MLMYMYIHIQLTSGISILGSGRSFIFLALDSSPTVTTKAFARNSSDSSSREIIIHVHNKWLYILINYIYNCIGEFK
jgi:hypothetical protein